MASGGSRLGSVPLGLRTTRSGTAGTRGPKSGGIQKRRGGAPRLDRDGDLVMDPSAGVNGNSASGNRGRGGSASGRGTRTAPGISTRGAAAGSGRHGGQGRARSGPTSIVKILGLMQSKAANNQDHGEKSLLEFLERKAHKEKNSAIRKVRV
jgi:nuclear RNA export factor